MTTPRLDSLTRRRTLVGVAVVLAGCLGDEDEDASPEEPRGPPGPEVGDLELHNARPLRLYALDGTLVADIHYHEDEGFSHWHFQPLEVPLAGTRELEATVYDAAADPVPLGEGYELAVTPIEDLDDPPAAFEIDAEQVVVEGRESGSFDVRFEVHAADDVWETPSLAVEVTDETEGVDDAT